MNDEKEQAQLYLITPSDAELRFYQDVLAPLLDQTEIACLRLGLSSDDESTISKHAELLREVAHQRDIPVLINTHYKLVLPLGLDGVHRVDAAKSIRDIRKEIGPDNVIGTHCGTSRHAGMNAGEIGADYVAFGPVASSVLTDSDKAGFDLFDFWIETVELPCVAEGNVTIEQARKLANVVDFFALGSEIFASENPANALKEYKTILDG